MSKDSKYQIEGERPLRTAPQDFDKFLKGSIWSDLSYTIKDRIEILTDALTQAEDVNQLIQLKGEIKAWREMLGLPSYLKSCADDETQRKNNNEEN